MIKKRTLNLLLALVMFFPHPSAAEMKIKQFGTAIYVENATVKELEDLFSVYRYTRFRALDNDAYPAIFVKTLPTDFQEMKSLKNRNELFIRILIPLALKINKAIENQRSTLLRIEESFNQNGELTEDETLKLEEFASKYDYFTKFKGKNRIAQQIQNLKMRINIIPPSVLIAAAAIETNWGFSRIANKANNLYQEKVWFTDEGLEPLTNKEDGYRFKIYDSLADSMEDFALKFNSDKKYANTWLARHEMLRRHKIVSGEAIAYSLAISSNMPNYAGILDYTSAFYDFFSIDNGHLKKD